MAISIHHGPNGSYKTAGVVQDFCLPAMKEGRTIVTNIRGFNRERCIENFDDTHPDFDVIYLDTYNKMEDREKLARFWHWAPLGALIIIDEANVIFPKAWTQKDIEKLTFPDGMKHGRPITMTEAFDMHRHYNWDIVFSAPNIKKLRDDIRGTTEGAYKHRNNKLIGFGGSYMEGFHQADNNGGKSDFITIVKKKIKPVVYSLYDSTSTGEVQDSSTGTSIFKNGKIQFLLGIIAISFGFSLYNTATGQGALPGSDKNNQVSLRTNQETNNLPLQKVADPDSSSNDGSLSDLSRIEPLGEGPFSDMQLSILAYIENAETFSYLFEATKDRHSIYLSQQQLKDAGYAIVKTSDCVVTVVYKQSRKVITCKPTILNRGGEGA